jgi:hypothetical protein
MTKTNAKKFSAALNICTKKNGKSLREKSDTELTDPRITIHDSIREASGSHLDPETGHPA